MFDQPDSNLSPGGLGRPLMASMSAGYSGQHQPQPLSPSGMGGMPGSFQWWAIQQQLASMSSQPGPNGYYGPGPFGGLPLAQPQPMGSPIGGGYGPPGLNYNFSANRSGNNNVVKPVGQPKRRAIYGSGRHLLYPSLNQSGGVDKLTDSFGELNVQASGTNGTNGHAGENQNQRIHPGKRRTKTPFFTNCEPSYSNLLTGGDGSQEIYSRKVFVGGLPPDIDEDEICNTFSRFGTLAVDWPHKAESKSYFPPKGYCFLIFEMECSVQLLMNACVPEGDKYYVPVSSPTMKDKPVQIRPWRLADADYVSDDTLPLDPRKTVFVGGVPRPLKAAELAHIMDRFYGGVCYCGIDTDPDLKYPKGAGRVAFSNQQSYIAAISARFVQLQQGDIDKRVEVKPYVLDDQTCDECGGSRCGHKFAPFFCANVTCLQYYCETCWSIIHARPGREYHKPLVKEGADRPRTIPFRYM